MYALFTSTRSIETSDQQLHVGQS